MAVSRRLRIISGSIGEARILPEMFPYPPNVLTLSCKNRLMCLPREAARRLPRPTRSGRSELAADVTRACSSRRPRRLAAGPADRRFLYAEHVRQLGGESPLTS